MDTSQQHIQVRGGEPKRRYRTVEEKRCIVEEALQAGASVARVARAHGVNANQVFAWRRLYRQGRLECRNETRALLPVRLVDSQPEGSQSAATPVRRTPSGVIHMEVPKGQLRITGCVEADALRLVLEKLLG